MKHSEIEIGKEYGVVPSWTYGGRGARDKNSCRENDVVKATLVSKDKYNYRNAHRDSDKSVFTLAPAGERSIGVLVKATDKTGSDVFWTSRLADIVALWSELEPIWEKRNAELNAEQEKAKEQQRKIDEHKEQVRNRIAQVTDSLVATSKELLGDKCKVSVATTGYDINQYAVVEMSLDEYERLIEMAYAGVSK